MLNIGANAPDFELKDQHGKLTKLTELLATGQVLVYFYPIDFSPVCTAQACGFRDRYPNATELGTQIVGISPQSVASHRRFAKTHALPFPLLADPSKRVIRAYDVNGPFGMGVRRATFLIDQSGVVRNSVLAEFSVASHMEILRQTTAT